MPQAPEEMWSIGRWVGWWKSLIILPRKAKIFFGSKEVLFTFYDRVLTITRINIIKNIVCLASSRRAPPSFKIVGLNWITTYICFAAFDFWWESVRATRQRRTRRKKTPRSTEPRVEEKLSERERRASERESRMKPSKNFSERIRSESRGEETSK